MIQESIPNENVPAINPLTLLSPEIQQEKLATAFSSIAPWLDTRLVLEHGARKQWSSEASRGEQLRQIEMWCQGLAESIKENSIQLAWIHDMVGKLGIYRGTSYRSSMEWMTIGMSISTDTMTFAIRQYSAWQAIEKYNVPPDLVLGAQPANINAARATIDESHRQYDELASRRAGNKPLNDLPFPEQQRLYQEIEEEYHDKVRAEIISALSTDIESAHEQSAQNGGPMDKGCFHYYGLSFDVHTMTLRGEFTCPLNPNQIQAMKLGKIGQSFQVGGERLTLPQYGRRISDMI